MSATVQSRQPIGLGLGNDVTGRGSLGLALPSLDDDGHMSPDPTQDGVEDQDDVNAVLQPAMSAAASHLTSQNTPAVEKAAALEKLSKGGFFDTAVPEDDDGADEDADDVGKRSPPSPSSDDQAPDCTPIVPAVTLKTTHRQQPPTSSYGMPNAEPLVNQSLPSPWQSAPRKHVFEKDNSDEQEKLRPSRGVLEAAFGPTRNRSRSAGQEALRKLQKAFPSLSTPSHLLPSLPSSFFSSFSEKSSPRISPSRSFGRSSPTLSPPTPPARTPLHTGQTGVRSSQSVSTRARTNSARASDTTRDSQSIQSRPQVLRRVTSDDSMLYHSLSRASSLGDDNQFQDVKEMVNMRLIAIKQSLPDVPNFKMPSLQKLHATRPFTMLNTLHSNEALDTTASRPSNLERESSSMIKDGTTVLDDVLDELTGDIVIMGGLRGSVLRSAEPPYQQYWAPVKVGLNMRKVNLEVGLDDEDEERMEETIIPSGMLTHMGPVDMSRKLFKKLRASNNARTGKLRVWNYGWDWRLSPALSSRKLQEFLAGLPSNKPGVPAESRGALIIAHSTGGLITRHAVNERPELFSGVLFAGVPQRCINILGPLRNGDVVLLNEKLLSAQVNFSMRTSFVFLPEDGFCFVDKNTGESYPVDFYDPQEWVKWRLSPCLAPALPALNRPQQPASSSPSLSSFLPSSLRSRSDSKGGERRWGGVSLDPTSALSSVTGKDRTIAPQLHTGATDAAAATPPPSPPLPTDPERERNLEYLTRTLAATRKFRAEMVHSVKHQADNRYPPLAVLYGKSTPTVYASQVNGREGIPCADAYDDLLFRPGDGVVLAKEAMLPDGYAIVKGGRVSTKNGHITMLGDLGAVGKALEALVRGRNKGIGMGGKLE